jgi:pantetheine-phosphate adenylyltransferase
LAEQKKRIAIYPGTFDPVTLGHLDILGRASLLFDEVIISVSKSSSKKTLFSLNERIKLIGEVTSSINNVKVETFSGLLVNYAKSVKANVIIRGLRAISDFEYEFQMALTNRKLNPDIETVFLMPGEKYSYISSSLVREIASLGADVSSFVPAVVAAAIAKKF